MGGAHRLRIAVDGEEMHAEPCHLGRRTLDRVGDVVQLEVEEDLLARLHEPLGDGEATPAVNELHADLVEADGIAEPVDERQGLVGARHVERGDQAIASVRLHGRILCGWSKGRQPCRTVRGPLSKANIGKAKRLPPPGAWSKRRVIASPARWQ